MWWFSNIVNETARVVTVDGISHKSPKVCSKRRGDAVVHIDGLDVLFEDAGHVPGGPHHNAVRLSIPASNNTKPKYWWHDGKGEMIVKFYKDKNLLHVMGCGNETWLEYNIEYTPVPRSPGPLLIPNLVPINPETDDFVYVCCARNDVAETRSHLLGPLTKLGWNRPFWIQGVVQENASSIREFISAAALHAQKTSSVLVYLTPALLHNPVCMGILEKLSVREKDKIIVVSTAEHMLRCENKLTGSMKYHKVHLLHGTVCQDDENVAMAIFASMAAKSQLHGNMTAKKNREAALRKLTEEMGLTYRKKVAIVVGVGEHPMLPKRPTVAKDILALQSLFVDIGFSHVRTLKDENATKVAILDTTASIAGKLQPEDLCVFVLLGHGADGVFYPYDGIPKKGQASNLDLDDIKAILKSFTTRHTVMVTDGFNISAFNPDPEADVDGHWRAICKERSAQMKRSGSMASQLSEGGALVRDPATPRSGPVECTELGEPETVEQAQPLMSDPYHTAAMVAGIDIDKINEDAQAQDSTIQARRLSARGSTRSVGSTRGAEEVEAQSARTHEVEQDTADDRKVADEPSLLDLAIPNLKAKSRILISRHGFDDSSHDKRCMSDLVVLLTKALQSPEMGTHATFDSLQEAALDMPDVGLLSKGHLPGHSGADSYLRL